MPRKIERVLIANRGAIATRIQRTLRKLGIESIAVFAEVDRASKHVADADYAVSLGEGGATETYLDPDKLLNAAISYDADAIHPGYGFLSENATFAANVEAAGLAFLGPTSTQIETFGLKHEARAVAVHASVPLLPGSGVLTSAEDALANANAIGFPVMLKSSAGGGGIGMRVCADPTALLDAYEAVAAQAASSFGDNRMFIERFVAAARHVEVQVFGDGEGDISILGDRDCSMQRRNQKIIEEAPAPELPEQVRQGMHAAAAALMQRVSYRSAGTVEFLYDAEREEFYFLEVNSRLQVEHGVTEMVTGIDIVEWMIRLGQGERGFMYSPDITGCAMQVRIYAEDPTRDFRPAPGLVSNLSLPSATEALRVDTWLEAGVQVPAAFDPMLAKIIAYGADRETAANRLRDSLDNARLDGVESNLAFLRTALVMPDFLSASHTTSTAADIVITGSSIEVLSPGTQSTVQDAKGRMGYWHVGVPPSGAFDYRSLVRANALVGNDENSAGLEMLASGPVLQFTAAARVAICGARTQAELDGGAVSPDGAFEVRSGQVLSIGRIAADGEGLRSYLAISGGIDVPEVLGSRATFDLGVFGGHAGRTLRTGDVLNIGSCDAEHQAEVPDPAPLSERTLLRVVQGPHIAPDFLTTDYLDEFYQARWRVHYNSSRTGIRLEGPTPRWVRPDGGNAGLHPSNVHDNAYAFGAIDFTGDMPIILGPDGPSLGGFVCPAAVAEVDRWKLGQLKPGDEVQFEPISLARARDLLHQRDNLEVVERSWQASAAEVIVDSDLQQEIVLRAAGDNFLLLEFGAPELDLGTRLRVEALQRWLRTQDHPLIEELTPGVRSLQFRVSIDADRDELVALIHQGLEAIGSVKNLRVPSRIVHLPLAWDDPATQEATERYMQSVREDAPWCPRNIEFIRRVNGLADEAEVKRIVYDASYLVLGLGDVYLGAPVATPIDPRHRLVTTKYNPARTWTPENAVGIGGAYLCIYGMEGPGGYQFVGRTLQVWNRYRQDGVFTKPWLLRGFDQLRFYEVSNDELLELRRDFPLGRVPLKIEDTEFSMAEYQSFLDSEAASIESFQDQQQAAFSAERQRWLDQGYDPNATAAPPAAEPLAVDDNGIRVDSPVTGSVWKVLVDAGSCVNAGEVVMIIESMKTEIEVLAPSSGTLQRLLAVAGTPVEAGSPVAVLEASAKSV